MSDSNGSAAPHEGRLLYLDAERAILAVRESDHAAQVTLRAELLEVLNRHARPLEQSAAVLSSLLAEVHTAYGRTMETRKG